MKQDAPSQGTQPYGLKSPETQDAETEAPPSTRPSPTASVATPDASADADEGAFDPERFGAH